ncbi:MAG TPA: polyhydroxyalkanoate granule-associated phasin [Burkholderiales bacterium]|nr:polyhydroxyalkanoate granule-associated phasin [Burkholderiales bacterium]
MFIEQWWRTASEAAQIWIAAPQVISLRSARLLADGFASRAGTRRELARMVQEKADAAGESAAAVALQVWRTNWELALMPLRLCWGVGAGVARWAPFMSVGGPLPVAPVAAPKQTAAIASRIVRSGLTPVRRRVTANAKRLRRLKPR